MSKITSAYLEGLLATDSTEEHVIFNSMDGKLGNCLCMAATDGNGIISSFCSVTFRSPLFLFPCSFMDRKLFTIGDKMPKLAFHDSKLVLE